MPQEGINEDPDVDVEEEVVFEEEASDEESYDEPTTNPPTVLITEAALKELMNPPVVDTGTTSPSPGKAKKPSPRALPTRATSPAPETQNNQRSTLASQIRTLHE